jgi:hypothetical protein
MTLRKILHSGMHIFKIELKICKILKPPQPDNRKFLATVFRVELSKHPLNLVRLSLPPFNENKNSSEKEFATLDIAAYDTHIQNRSLSESKNL